MPEITVADLLTLTGASGAVMALFEVAKRLWAPSAAQLDRFGPLIALTLGVAVVEGASLALGADPAQGAVTGAAAGLYAIGLYKVAGRIVGEG